MRNHYLNFLKITTSMMVLGGALTAFNTQASGCSAKDLVNSPAVKESNCVFVSARGAGGAAGAGCEYTLNCPLGDKLHEFKGFAFVDGADTLYLNIKSVTGSLEQK